MTGMKVACWALASLAIAAGIPTAQANPYLSGQRGWIVDSGDIYTIEQYPAYLPYTSTAVTGYFANGLSYVMSPSPLQKPSKTAVYPRGAIRTYDDSSFQHLQQTVPALITKDGINAVLYDVLNSPTTPREEQSDPYNAIGNTAARFLGGLTAYRTASHYLTFIVAPDPKLYQQISPNTPLETTLPDISTGTLADAPSYIPPVAPALTPRAEDPEVSALTANAFLKYNFPGMVAAASKAYKGNTILVLPVADWVKFIQPADYANLALSKPSKKSPTFSQLVQQGVSQARAVAPAIKIYVDLRANTAGVSLDQLKYAVASTICLVNGYRLTLAPGTSVNSNAQMAGMLLTWMASQAQHPQVCPK